MSSPSGTENVLLIGASRGLGYAIAEEYIDRGARVVATVRGQNRTALNDRQETAGGRLEIEHVDINEPDQVQGLRDRLGARRFGLLFVVAGVTNSEEETVADVPADEFVRLMVTNALSPMRAIETLGGLVRPDGTIAIMSSGQGRARRPRRPAHDRGERPRPGHHHRRPARAARPAVPRLPGPDRPLVTGTLVSRPRRRCVRRCRR